MEEVWLLWFKIFSIKRLKVVVLIIKSNKTNNCLKNCTKQLLKKLKRRVYSSFKDNIWGIDLADLQLISNL